MTDEKMMELLNREIDGLNSPQESAELRAYLESHPDARMLYNDLITITSSLSRVREVDPPATLKSNILASIPSEMSAARRRSSIVGRLFDFIDLRPSFQFAYGIAAGLILGVTIYSLVGGNDATISLMDPSSVSGTILNDSANPLTAGASYKVSLPEHGASATLQAKYSKHLALVEVGIQTEHELNLVFLFNSQELQFKGYSQSRPVPGSMKLTQSSFQMTIESENRYILAFDRRSQAPSDVTFMIMDSGKQLFEKKLVLGP